MLWQKVKGTQVLAAGGTSSFENPSRYTEIHAAGYFTADPNTENTIFFTPSVQWGWTDSFSTRTYLTTLQIDVGLQL